MKKGWGCFLVLLLLGLGSVLIWYESRLAPSARDKLEEKVERQSTVFSWLTVEGTKIDYPVYRHPTDDRYYLSHDGEGNPTQYGAIFMESVNAVHLDDPMTILYGHAMRDDSMFGSLDYFADESFFEAHRQIELQTTEKAYQYEIFAAYTTGDEHLYHTYQLGDRQGVAAYLAGIEERASQQGGFYRQIAFDSQADYFLILSTCDVAGDDQRFVVHAVRRGD